MIFSLKRLEEKTGQPRDATDFLRRRTRKRVDDMPDAVRELAEHYDNLMRAVSTLVVLGRVDEDDVVDVVRREPHDANGNGHAKSTSSIH